ALPCARARKRIQHLRPGSLERVDAHIERRASRKRGPFPDPVVAEGLDQMRLAPFGTVGTHGGRRVGQIPHRGCSEYLLVYFGGRETIASQFGKQHFGRGAALQQKSPERKR